MSTDDTNRAADPSLAGDAGPAPVDPTREIPTESTSELPTIGQVPFRVEPDAPVRDDTPRASETPPQYPPPQYSQHSAPPSPAHAPAPTPALVTVAKGPRPGTVLLGLLTMVVAAWVLVVNLTGAQLDLERFGPLAIGGLGVALLLIGLVGVMVGRRR
jgi:hypothetical protein